MEDKYKPSDEFTDHAWSEMKALLDKEMPDKGAVVIVPEQGRPKNLLLLLSLLLFLSLAALFFYCQSSHSLSTDLNVKAGETIELAVISTEKGIDAADEELQSVSAENVETNASANALDSNQAATSSQKADSSRVKNSKANTKKNTASAKSYNQSLIPKANNTHSKSLLATQNKEQGQISTTEKESSIGKETQVAKPFILDSEKVFLGTENEKVEEATNEKNPPIALVSPIDAKSLNLLDLHEEKQNLDDFLNVNKLEEKSAIFAFAGARNYDLAAKIDFVGGLETVFRKNDKKLGLRTGFNYAQRSTVYLTQEESIALVDFEGSGNGVSFEDPSLPGGFYQARADLNTNPIKYHFLEVPLFLDYKLSKKWSVHGGIAAKSLFYASEQNFGLLNGINIGRQQDAAFEIENNSQDERVNVSYFAPRKFNVGASVGFNFRAADRLGIQARFSQNLLDVYPELPNNQRSNSIELGMSWRIR